MKTQILDRINFLKIFCFSFILKYFKNSSLKNDYREFIYLKRNFFVLKKKIECQEKIICKLILFYPEIITNITIINDFLRPYM